MKSSDFKGELCQYRLQYGQQVRLADLRHRSHHLPLRHLIDGCDVIHALDSILVALMHRVDADESWPPMRLWPPPLANRPGGRLRRFIRDPTLPISPAVAKSIQLRYRRLGQPLVLAFAKVIEIGRAHV